MGHRFATRRATASAISVIVICALTAACSTSSPEKAPSPSTGAGHRLAFSRCMRAHDVPNFPDPGAPARYRGSESSFAGISIPPTIDTQSPAFHAAEKSCQPLLAAIASPQGKPPITASLKESLIAGAHCMRDHGVPNFPDPTFPASGGISQGVPVNPKSPAFQRAQKICRKAR